MPRFLVVPLLCLAVLALPALAAAQDGPVTRYVRGRYKIRPMRVNAPELVNVRGDPGLA